MEFDKLARIYYHMNHLLPDSNFKKQNFEQL